jgi:hypothetical protein
MAPRMFSVVDLPAPDAPRRLPGHSCNRSCSPASRISTPSPIRPNANAASFWSSSTFPASSAHSVQR